MDGFVSTFNLEDSLFDNGAIFHNVNRGPGERNKFLSIEARVLQCPVEQPELRARLRENCPFVFRLWFASAGQECWHPKSTASESSAANGFFKILGDAIV